MEREHKKDRNTETWRLIESVKGIERRRDVDERKGTRGIDRGGAGARGIDRRRDRDGERARGTDRGREMKSCSVGGEQLSGAFILLTIKTRHPGAGMGMCGCAADAVWCTIMM